MEGIITALVTPFKKGEVDYASLKKLIRFQLDQGVDAFVVHGTTAESPTTTAEEKEKIFQFIKSEVSAQIPLIVGTGTNSTRTSCQNTKEAKRWGADAALVVVPYYNKPPQRGLEAHFQEVASSSELPIILYNVPGRTITSLEVSTIEKLSHHPQIIGIKEATGDMLFGSEVVKSCGKQIVVLSGDDKSSMELAALGGRGIIGVVTHLIAKEMKSIYQKIQNGKKEAKQELEKYFSLIDSMYLEANPIAVKYALKKMGIIESEELRLPLVSLREDYRERVHRELQIL